ncbi:hypothetical protein FACS1894125_4630 [Actinomycetota bacterium]|nr:hypothetical protein FACS1894125_4630 [Actinomycetota bacterium]
MSILKRSKSAAVVVVLILLALISLTSCSDSNSGTTSVLAKSTLNIGIKYDQPGLGYKSDDQFTGFDVDVARYVAHKLGFTDSQINWKEANSKQRETLLQNGDVDMIFATYSITDKRKQAVSFAGPYFVAGQDLLVRKDDNDITGPDTLDGKNLCSVTGSTSAQTIKDKFSKGVNLMEQPGYAECVTALRSGSVDAVSTDDIILAGLAAQLKATDLKVVGNPFTQEAYGVGIKKGDAALAQAINDAIQAMFDDGSWDKAIEENTTGTGYHYNDKLNPPQFEDIELIAQQADEQVGGGEGLDGFIYLFQNYNILGAFLVNLELTFWAALFSLILGVLILLMRICPISSLRVFAGGFVEFFRNIPLTIVMVFMVLGAFGQLKLQFSDNFDVNFFWLAVVGLTLYHSAFVAESLRAGVNTVPIGQAEAARSLGFSFSNSALRVILPQAIRGSIAPLGNTLIALLKNTTVAATASVATETSTMMSNMIEFDPQQMMPIFITFALGFVVLVIPIGVLTTYLSERLAVKR